MRGTILLIEDSPEYQAIVKKILHQHVLVMVDDPDLVVPALDAGSIDLILLDISLPKRDGFTVLQELKANPAYEKIPVMCLTGKDQISDKVTAFSLGAEDYIQKPFNALEFQARVEAKITKLKKNNRSNLIVGEVEIDLTAHRVFSSATKEEITLTQTEFKILLHLARHPGQVFTREQLLADVWGDGAAVFDRAVDVHVCSLRKKLGKSAVSIKSVAGVGYKLICDKPKPLKKAS